MSRNTKRKFEDFDPNKTDSEDEDYDNRADPPARSRPKVRTSSAIHKSRKPPKRKREAYGDSDDDIEDDEEVSSEEEASPDESSAEEEEMSAATGRRKRTAARKQVNYDESSEDEIQATSDEEEPSPRAKRSQPKRSLIVKLQISPDKMRTNTPGRARRPGSRRGPTPEIPSGGTRRSSRISRHSEEPLLELTDSGRHAQPNREGSREPSAEPARRVSSRAGKGLKKPFPSIIMEASQEESGPADTVVGNAQGSFISQLQEHAAEDVEMKIEGEAGDDAAEEDVVPSSQAEAEENGEQDEIFKGDVHAEDDDDDDDDDGPVKRRTSRTLRSRKEASPPNTRRSERQRKQINEQSSDFEPEEVGDDDAEAAEANLSDDDEPVSGKRKAGRSDGSDSGTGRRSGRLAKRARSQRASAQSESGGSELDVDEIADEAAELDEDRRRNKRQRPRRGRRVEEISYEPNLRNRSNRPDYRVWRPEVQAQLDEDDTAAPPAASQPRGKRGNAPYRSLFSTLGPFGGAGGPAPVFGGPAGQGAAVGGADSDSSDDDMARRPSHAVGGAVGMTPTQGQQPFGLIPQTHNTDPQQAGSGPAGFGKVKDKKALADADPLGVDPNVTFDGVGGLGTHIDRLKEMVALPLLYPEIFMRMHVTPPRGVLFHGPPGTGKTLLARALASSVSSHGKKVTFYMRKGADALSKWVGEAERQLRLLFEEARKNQPSIIFFDEIDGLAPVRSSKQEQIHASIVATLLALMDGMDGRGQVIVIGATNRPDSVDPALRRPGRFDREFYFPLPNKDARRSIIDIHTKGWEPALKPRFKDQLAELTKGYGGADLRALCTEAALNAVQGTFPQIYSSSKKLLIDPSQIKVLAKDFMISVNKMVPSSERSANSGSAPLKKGIEPLLQQPLTEIHERLKEMVPSAKKRTALEEAEYDDRDDELGFEKENMQREFESAKVFRPRLLIRGLQGMGQQYLGAALLNKFDGMYVANFDLQNIYKDSTRSAEAAVVQLFEEVKRHKPSVIYIPQVDIWYHSLQDSVIKTFTGMLRSLAPTDPVLVLGVLEHASMTDQPDKNMMRDLFGYSRSNIFVLERPDSQARQQYFAPVLDYIRQSPSEFPDPINRKKREIPTLPEAPVIPEKPKEMTKEELKEQRKLDRYTLNTLKAHIQLVMDQIKQKYRKFRTPPVDERLFSYLFDEQDPGLLTTDLAEDEAQQHMHRPYKIDYDKKGVAGLREIATGKFYYNIEIDTIEKRLSNGYYKRPQDFEADIRRLAKDARTLGDQERILKANELLSNVEVDMTNIEKGMPALAAECEAVYQREVAREAEEKKKRRAAGQEPGPPTVPPQDTASTDPSTGPIRLGIEFPTMRSVPPPFTPHKADADNRELGSNGSAHPLSNGSDPRSHVQEDFEMSGSQDTSGHMNRPQYTTPGQNTQTQRSQHSSIMQMAPGSQARDYVNSASTTTSGQKTGDRSHSNRSSDHTGNTQRSNGVNGHGHDYSMFEPAGGSQLPDTQEHPVGSQQTPHSSPDLFSASQQMGPPTGLVPTTIPKQPTSSSNSNPSQRRASDIDSLLNHPATPQPPTDHPTATSAPDPSMPAPTLIPPDPNTLSSLALQITQKSSGLSVEQLEQVMASLMRTIWSTRHEWNRNAATQAVKSAFNETVEDIELTQKTLKMSQEDDEYAGVGSGRDALGFGRGSGVGSYRGSMTGVVQSEPVPRSRVWEVATQLPEMVDSQQRG